MPDEPPSRKQGSDWQLLEQTATGDEEAFRCLVERHQKRVVGLCERLLGDTGEALDAAQEVFLQTFRRAGRLEPRGQLYTWLYRVATNHCLNLLRRRSIVRFLSLSRGSSADDRLELDPADGAAGPDEALEARRRWRATRRAIGDLPESQRVVLVLAKFEGMSYREIADTLSITVPAVESRLFRAMRRLEKAQELFPQVVTEEGEP